MKNGQYEICICDDDILFLKILRQKIAEIFAKKKKEYEIYSYSDSGELIKNRLTKADLYFLDIDMPGISGMDVAKQLINENKEAAIIFISNYEETVFEAIHYAPFRFIRKAYLETELPEAIAAWEKEHRRRRKNRMILEIKTKEGITAVPCRNIIYIESNRHYLCVKCKDGEHRTRGKLSDYEKTLKEAGFVRAGIGYMVNCRWIKQLKTSQLTLKTDEVIAISRGRFEEVKHTYMEYVREDTDGDD